MTANATTALQLFQSFAAHPGPRRTRYMGLDVRALTDDAHALSASRRAVAPATSDKDPLEFDLVLRPAD
jgi:hypothetical protein